MVKGSDGQCWPSCECVGMDPTYYLVVAHFRGVRGQPCSMTRQVHACACGLGVAVGWVRSSPSMPHLVHGLLQQCHAGLVTLTLNPLLSLLVIRATLGEVYGHLIILGGRDYVGRVKLVATGSEGKEERRDGKDGSKDKRGEGRMSVAERTRVRCPPSCYHHTH